MVIRKLLTEAGMVLHTYNPSTMEPEAGGPNFKASLY